GAVVAEELVTDAVEFVGGHPRDDVPPDLLARLGRQTSGDPHLLDRLVVLDLVAGEWRRRRLVDVLGTSDVGGDGAARRDPPGLDRCSGAGHAASVVSEVWTTSSGSASSTMPSSRARVVATPTGSAPIRLGRRLLAHLT